MDDDDEFLYGPSTTSTTPTTPSAPQSSATAPQPTSRESTQAASTNGVVSTLEEQIEEPGPPPELEHQSDDNVGPNVNDDEQESEEVELDDEDEESDDDVEIVMEAPSRTLDLRPNRPPTTRTGSGAPPKGPAPSSLTTEYTILTRGAPAPTAHSQQTGPSTPQQAAASSSQPTPGLGASPQQPLFQQQPQQTLSQSQSGGEIQQQQQQEDDGIDTSTLPPVTAPPSHPTIDPSENGIYDGRPILEVDLDALADKPWRRPGSDISDWFNYGFDEISWEAYCYRRRDLGELAHVLKTNIINFSGMTEEQLPVLPPEVRTMVMTGANVAMNNAAQGMMGPGMMMDMSGMVGPMGMDMGMGPGMMPGMMQDASQQQVGMMQGANPGDQQVGNVGMMQDGYAAAGTPAGLMNMGMNDYGMQEQNPMVQQIYSGMDVSQGVPGVQAGAGRGQIPYRGTSRGGSGGPVGGSVPPSRTRGGFAGRGRDRIYEGAGPPSAPVRPASPLPPGVPTGPRNQNKYKDRDGNAPAVDGLDYGGGKDGGDRGRRTPSGEPEERSSSRYSHDRKRRSSPGMDDLRSSKRR